jgi:hypothetical protein
MSFAEADYGEQTPEHFDRFGVRHFVRYTVNHRARDFVDTNPSAPVTRFKLTLQQWWRSWPGLQTFRLDLDGRPMEIRIYSDGRVKIILDDDVIYAEKNKVVTRNWVKHREVAKWRTDRVEQEEAAEQAEKRAEEAEEEKQKRIDAVRERLKKGANHDRAGSTGP